MYCDNKSPVYVALHTRPHTCNFKVNNRNTRKKCEIRSALIVKKPERRH